MDFFKRVNKAVRGTAEKETNETGIARVTRELNELNVGLEKLFNEYGKAAYAAFKGTGEAEAADKACADIDTSYARIAELKEELDVLNGVRRCPACGAVLPRAARFCMTCGAPQPEDAPKAEEPKPEEPKPEEAPAEEAPAAEPEKAFCPNCGAVREGEGDVCAACGQPYEAPAEAPAEEPAEEADEEEQEDDEDDED